MALAVTVLFCGLHRSQQESMRLFVLTSVRVNYGEG